MKSSNVGVKERDYNDAGVELNEILYIMAIKAIAPIWLQGIARIEQLDK